MVGLGDVAIGDQVGRWDPERAGRHFPDPGLESVVEPRDPGQRTRLFEALRRLAEQDPLIDTRVDGQGAVVVTVYGEVQKEVLAARLEEGYGVLADFLPTRVVHVERVSGTGEGHALAPMGNVRIGLRLAPAAPGTGLDYALADGVEKGWLLPHYHHALEEQLAAELAEGLHGWRVADLEVRTVVSRWAAPVPSPSDFRAVTHDAFRRALLAAGTVVCAPVSRFGLEVPADRLSAVLGALVERGAKPEPVGPGPGSLARVVGTLPTAQVADLEQRLPGYTSGRGAFWSEPAGLEPFPRRPRGTSLAWWCATMRTPGRSPTSWIVSPRVRRPRRAARSRRCAPRRRPPWSRWSRATATPPTWCSGPSGWSADAQRLAADDERAFAAVAAAWALPHDDPEHAAYRDRCRAAGGLRAAGAGRRGRDRRAGPHRPAPTRGPARAGVGPGRGR